MQDKSLQMNQSERDDIAAAEQAIAEICKKYGVSLVGDYEEYSDDWGCDDPIICHTNATHVVSERYNDRIRARELEIEEREKERIRTNTQRFFNSMLEQHPNARSLKVIEREWKQPTYFGHGPWQTTSLFIDGLVVKNWKLIKKSPFGRNPNGFWQYTKYKRDDWVIASVSLCAYPGTDCVTVFSHPGNIKMGIYAEGSNMSDIQSQAFVVQMVDELIASGALELQ